MDFLRGVQNIFLLYGVELTLGAFHIIIKSGGYL